MDSSINQFVNLEGHTHEQELKAKRDLAIRNSKTLNSKEKNKFLKMDLEAFKEGEIVIIHGYQFRIARIDAKKLILRPVKF